MLKKISSLCLAVLLTLMMVVPTFAQSEMPTGVHDSLIISAPISAGAEGTIISGDARTRGATVLAAYTIRSGNTEKCEIYLSWAGTDLYSSWKFSSCTIDNAGVLIFNEEYGTIKGATKNVTAAAAGTVKLGEVNIPTDVTQARIKISGLQGYNLTSASWLSASVVSKLGDIN